MGTVDSTATPPQDDRTYFAIGIQPQDARVMVFEGGVSGGRFIQNPMATASLYGNPVDGFILGEAHAGETLAIMIVQVMKPDQRFFALSFAPCGKVKTIVFTAPPGKVVYVGSVKYDANSRGLSPSYTMDLDGARDFVKAHYPNLTARLEQGSYDLLPAGPESCGY